MLAAAGVVKIAGGEVEDDASDPEPEIAEPTGGEAIVDEMAPALVALVAAGRVVVGDGDGVDADVCAVVAVVVSACAA